MDELEETVQNLAAAQIYNNLWFRLLVYDVRLVFGVSDIIAEVAIKIVLHTTPLSINQITINDVAPYIDALREGEEQLNSWIPK